jgi:hypothetical protein
MEQPKTAVQRPEDGKKFEQWCFKQTVEIEHTKKKLADEQLKLEEERQNLDREKRDFLYRKDMDQSRIRQEQHLFDMKWKILEDELQKLAVEKQQVQKQKEFYSRVHDYENTSKHNPTYTATSVVKGEMFFIGVINEDSLKKRYKDLIKIYHPDNLAGDSGTIQEINREYDKLKKRLGL